MTPDEADTVLVLMTATGVVGGIIGWLSGRLYQIGKDKTAHPTVAPEAHKE